MALPISRNKTYASNTPVDPNDMNDFQDQIISLSTKIGGGTLTFSVPLFSPISSNVGVLQFLQTGAQGKQVQIPNLIAGSKILSVSARIRDNVTGPTKLTIGLFEQQDAGQNILFSAGTPSSGGGTFQSISSTGSAATVVSGRAYYVLITPSTGTATCDIVSADVTIRLPV